MDGLKGKKLLLLGGVRPACEIIREAQSMGVETFVTDYIEDSPAKKIAEHSYMVNALDVDGVAELCRKEKIDGVITGYVDMLLPYAQQICEKINRPFWGNAANIDMAINKEKFKSACEKSGVQVVPWKIANKDNYSEVLKEIVPPVVMKPVDNSGSRGVVKCYETAMLNECAQKALSYSKCGEILIEKAMDPHCEFSVYYMLNHGECYLTGMGDRYVNIADTEIAPVGQGMLFPSVHLSEWIEKMDGSVRKFFKDNEMNDGFIFVQGFYENHNYYVHEIGYRLNGGFSYKIIDYFSKYNQIKELIKFSLTGDMDKTEIQKSNPFFDGYGMIITATLKPGTICSVAGKEEIEKENGVLQFCQLHDVGEKLMSRGTTAQVFAYILCATKTKEEMQKLINLIQDKLIITGTDGSNILNPIIDPSRILFER